jgi:hypothetical protein
MSRAAQHGVQPDAAGAAPNLGATFQRQLVPQHFLRTTAASSAADATVGRFCAAVSCAGFRPLPGAGKHLYALNRAGRCLRVRLMPRTVPYTQECDRNVSRCPRVGFRPHHAAVHAGMRPKRRPMPASRIQAAHRAHNQRMRPKRRLMRASRIHAAPLRPQRAYATEAPTAARESDSRLPRAPISAVPTLNQHIPHHNAVYTTPNRPTTRAADAAGAADNLGATFLRRLLPPVRALTTVASSAAYGDVGPQN